MKFSVTSNIFQFSPKKQNFYIFKIISRFPFMNFSRNFHFWDFQEISIFPIFWVFWKLLVKINTPTIFIFSQIYSKKSSLIPNIEFCQVFLKINIFCLINRNCKDFEIFENFCCCILTYALFFALFFMLKFLDFFYFRNFNFLISIFYLNKKIKFETNSKNPK